PHHVRARLQVDRLLFRASRSNGHAVRHRAEVTPIQRPWITRQRVSRMSRSGTPGRGCLSRRGGAEVATGALGLAGGGVVVRGTGAERGEGTHGGPPQGGGGQGGAPPRTGRAGGSRRPPRRSRPCSRSAGGCLAIESRRRR